MKPIYKNYKWLESSILYVLCSVSALLVMFPLLYALVFSFFTSGEANQFPPKFWPSTLYLKNYYDAWNSIKIYRFVINSTVISVLITAGQLITASLSAYAFSFFTFKGRNVLFIMFIAPYEATLIPNYLTVRSLGWLDTYQGMAVPFLASALGMFLLRQHFMTIPKDLYEAAQIDGFGRFRFLLSVVIPLSRPALATFGVYTFMQAWNAYVWPLLVTNSNNMRTVQIGITMLRWEESMSWGLVLAGVIIVLLPSVLSLIAAQKQLVEGLTAGAVKY